MVTVSNTLDVTFADMQASLMTVDLVEFVGCIADATQGCT